MNTIKIHTLVLIILLAVTGCIISSDELFFRKEKIRYMPVPKDVMKLTENTVAFYITHRGGNKSEKRVISTSNLQMREGDKVELFEYTQGTLRYVPSEDMKNGKISANLKNGSVYIMTIRQGGNVGLAARLLCEYARNDLVFMNRLCPLIYCPGLQGVNMTDIQNAISGFLGDFSIGGGLEGGEFGPGGPGLGGHEHGITTFPVSDFPGGGDIPSHEGFLPLEGWEGDTDICSQCTGGFRHIPIEECSYEPVSVIPINSGKILFQSNRTGFNNDLYIVQPDGSNLTNITSTPYVNESWPSWSADGKNIVYVKDPRTDPGDTFGWDMELIIADESGEIQNVIDSGAPLLSPIWSPSGNRISYLKMIEGVEGYVYFALFFVERFSVEAWSDPEPVCQDEVDLCQAVNVMAQRFMFYGDDSVVFDFYDINAPNIAMVRLDSAECVLKRIAPSQNTSFQYEPDVTLFGKMLFVKNENSIADLLSVPSFEDADNTSQLTTDGKCPTFASWSNNDRFVAYQKIHDYSGGLYILDTTTGEERFMSSTASIPPIYYSNQLVDPQYWSPDDKRVILLGGSIGNYPSNIGEIYIIDIEQDTVVNVSNHPTADDSSPHWQPKSD